MPETARRTIEAEDLYRLQLVSDCQISPDGHGVAFCVERVDRDSEKKFTNLWLVRTDDGWARQLTHGNQIDRHPRWSPDGESLAFMSNRDDEDQFQIYLLPMAGGEARPLTAMKGSFDNLQWSPDGSELVCQFRKKDQEAIDREADPAKKELGIVARRITRVFYKLDGAGYLPQERWHIWTIDVDTGIGQQLTDGEICDEISPCWSPDGRQIAFLSNRSPDPDLEPDAMEVFMIPAGRQSAEVDFTRLETPPGSKALLSYSPDGRYLSFVGQDTPAGWWKNHGIWLVPVDGSSPARDITAPFDLEVGNATLGDIADRPTSRPLWSADSRRIYFLASQNGSTGLYSISLQGEDLLPEVLPAGVAGAFSLRIVGSRIAGKLGDSCNQVIALVCFFLFRLFIELGNCALEALDFFFDPRYACPQDAVRPFLVGCGVDGQN